MSTKSKKESRKGLLYTITDRDQTYQVRIQRGHGRHFIVEDATTNRVEQSLSYAAYLKKRLERQRAAARGMSPSTSAEPRQQHTVPDTNDVDAGFPDRNYMNEHLKKVAEAAATNREERWQEHNDPHTNKDFLYNRVTGESKWKGGGKKKEEQIKKKKKKKKKKRRRTKKKKKRRKKKSRKKGGHNLLGGGI